MPAHFDLVITADHATATSELRLLDDSGAQIAFRHTDFKQIPVGQQRGLFDLRNYLRLYVEGDRETAAVAEIGVCIADAVLGPDIFEPLWQSESQRTLRIQLPGATTGDNVLAAALARVPWEIARPSADQPTLAERNLLVRMVHDAHASASKPIGLAADEALRVLFVFADGRGSSPLGARKERRALLDLFEREIYPNRRVVAHALSHGVTRERLAAQIREHDGYHIVHWSGHGHLNMLELARPGGENDRLSGQELLDLFTAAGGFFPRLFFLSACHSGDILRVEDWNDFLAVAQGNEPGTKPAENAPANLTRPSGYTGTAHALLQGGVPSVVAMRYAVSDDYARELAVEFYRALLAHAQPKTPAAALTMARQLLLDGQRHDSARFAVCDHATPLLYGTEQPGLAPVRGRSPALNPRDPRRHQITELTSAGHEHFVGRTWELAGLGSDFIGASMGTEVQPVAVITGLGGMGKTALTAEALALWESRFEWVLLYQAKPNALPFDATLRDIDLKLRGELGRYHSHVKARPADAIYRDASVEFTGPERLDRLTRNLVRALRDEPILLVLDNFETNLKPLAEPVTADGQPVWACQDPAWDRCLTALATALAGSPSRVLITCRRPIAALADGRSHAVVLGPLPSAEAALYLREHPVLSGMVFGTDAGEKALALRLLNASRFHPLLMDRLAQLAADATLRPQLLHALDALEQTKDFAELPALFATTPGDTKQIGYLADALATSLDQLIADTSPDARRLLWMIAVANDKVALTLLKGVWSGESYKQQQLRQVKRMLEILPRLPEHLQAKLMAMPPGVRASIDALPAEAPANPDVAPLLRYLLSLGLATAERTGPDDENPELTCHELVRERIRLWMEQHPQDRGGQTENLIRLAYAERLKAAYQELRDGNMSAALQAGRRAVVYCVQAEAWDQLGGFASEIVTSTTDPRALEALIPHLQTAAEAAPEGAPRRRCLGHLADALARGGRQEISLQLFENAAIQARAGAEGGGEGSEKAWSDVAWITGNWANALGDVGDLDGARRKQLEAAEAHKAAGHPALDVVGVELEALRIDIMQGRVGSASPEVEARLAQTESWWTRHRSGERVTEAPDGEMLARAFISALDVAREVHHVQSDFASALRRTDRVLEVKRALKRPADDIASDRCNRAVALSALNRFDESRAELEACLRIFRDDIPRTARTLSALADVFARQGDLAQAITQQRRALGLRARLPDPAERALSHNNLAVYLARRATPSEVAESTYHQLAAIVYLHVAGLRQRLEASLPNYAIDFREARTAGTVTAVPRVTELLADPAFQPLEQWLLHRQVNLEKLQTEVDQFLAQARQAALSQE